MTSKKTAADNGKMKRKAYEKELRKLQVELCHLQDWVKDKGARIIILFEGRDAAGKGGTIKAITERREPARVSGGGASGALGSRKNADVHAALHRAIPGRGRGRHLRPQLVQSRRRRIRDGILHQGAASAFPELCPQIEKYIVDGGIMLIKIWLEVGKDEQERRFAARIDDPLRQWKLSPMDLESYGRWYDYSRARDMMLEATDSKHAPWYIVRSDDKRRARLNCISHILKIDPLQEGAADEGQAAQAFGQGQIRRSGIVEGKEIRRRSLLMGARHSLSNEASRTRSSPT